MEEIGKCSDDCKMKAVVLTFDCLPIGFLGCYGNSLVETPQFDRLASQAVVFDQHFAENVGGAAARHAWMTGCYHFPRTALQQSVLPDLAAALRSGGVETDLISEVGSQVPVVGFDWTHQVRGSSGLDAQADETPFAKLILQAELVLENWAAERGTSRLLWLQSRGVPLPWLPPREFAEAALARQLEIDSHDDNGREELPIDDASSWQSAEETQCESAADHEIDSMAAEAGDAIDLADDRFDPFIEKLIDDAISDTPASRLSPADWLLARAVFAGYVELLDRSFGRLLAALESQLHTEPLLIIVTAAEGLSVGERPMVSLPATDLPEPVIHTPLMVQMSGGESGTRRQTLVQTVDLMPTLLDWFQIASPGRQCEGRSLIPLVSLIGTEVREYLCLGDDNGATAIRTKNRHLVKPAGESQGEDLACPHLYTKPDDIWDVHDVAAQSPAEADSLSSTLEQFIRCAQSTVPLKPPVLQ